MFTVDPTIVDLKGREGDLSKVLFSMNIHQVATPDLSVEDARSYVFFLRGGGKIEIYIGLYFIKSGSRLYYTHSANPFPEGQLTDNEAEARAFAEDLGAMLDEIDLSKLSSSEKSRWIEDHAILSGKKETDVPAEIPAEGPQPGKQAAVEAIAVEQPGQAESMPVPAGGVEQQEPVWPLPEVKPVIEQKPAAPLIKPAAMAARQQPPAAAPVQLAIPATPDTEQEPVQQAIRPRRKTVPPAEQAGPAAAPNPGDAAQRSRAEQFDTVLEEAVRAGVVKMPKVQLHKGSRSTAVSISRDKEALARLLASF